MSSVESEKCERKARKNKQRRKVTFITCAGCDRGFWEGGHILGNANVRRDAGCSCYVLNVQMFCLRDRPKGAI